LQEEKEQQQAADEAADEAEDSDGSLGEILAVKKRIKPSFHMCQLHSHLHRHNRHMGMWQQRRQRNLMGP
jgi:hypothetical protein